MILNWGGMVGDINTEDYVYGKLKNAIFKRYIRPDTRLVESKIAEQLGVSRTPVRGAIKRLAHDGFVKLSNNKGASIVKPTTKEIYDTFAVRAQLEKMAAARAIENLTAEDVARLELYLSGEIDTFAKRDIGIYYNLNFDFHIYLAEISKNLILKEYLSSIINRSHIYLILYENFYQLEYNPSYDEHKEIIDAIKNKNIRQCEKAIDQHFKTTLEGLKLEEIEKAAVDDFLIL
jgi:DNA-binding GntR family transcriptional regulator